MANPFALEPTLASLHDDARRCLGRLWANRAKHERETAGVFAQLHQDALALELQPTLVGLARRGIDDERSHANLCAEVASQYLGEQVRMPSRTNDDLLLFQNCSPRESRMLTFLRHCCFSETIAVAYLVRCKEECTIAPLRAVLQQLLKDEMTHARLGWAALVEARPTDEEFRTLSAALPELFEASYEGWRSGYREESRGLVLGHGFISAETLSNVVSETLTEVILPGLGQVGIDVCPAQTWIEHRLAKC